MNYTLLSSPVVHKDINDIASRTSTSLKHIAGSTIGITGANGFLTNIIYIFLIYSIFNLQIQSFSLSVVLSKAFSPVLRVQIF